MTSLKPHTPHHFSGSFNEAGLITLLSGITYFFPEETKFLRVGSTKRLDRVVLICKIKIFTEHFPGARQYSKSMTFLNKFNLHNNSMIGPIILRKRK